MPFNSLNNNMIDDFISIQGCFIIMLVNYNNSNLKKVIFFINKKATCYFIHPAGKVTFEGFITGVKIKILEF